MRQCARKCYACMLGCAGLSYKRQIDDGTKPTDSSRSSTTDVEKADSRPPKKPKSRRAVCQRDDEPPEGPGDDDDDIVADNEESDGEEQPEQPGDADGEEAEDEEGRVAPRAARVRLPRRPIKTRLKKMSVTMTQRKQDKERLTPSKTDSAAAGDASASARAGLGA